MSICPNCGICVGDFDNYCDHCGCKLPTDAEEILEEQYEELTIGEIESRLGYRIKIVSEDVRNGGIINYD